jgi:hypothetical protein
MPEHQIVLEYEFCHVLSETSSINRNRSQISAAYSALSLSVGGLQTRIACVLYAGPQGTSFGLCTESLCRRSGGGASHPEGRHNFARQPGLLICLTRTRRFLPLHLT